jgi:hypothetical protein
MGKWQSAKNLRLAAIQQGEKFYFTGAPCKHGHIAKRRVSTSTCIECTKLHNDNAYNKNKSNENYIKYRRSIRKDWYDRNPEKVKNMCLKRNYGITLDDYNKMYEEQNGCCAICGKSESLAVDHDHSTGKIRALLCHKCNKGLGLFDECPSILSNAISYVTAHLSKPDESP